MSSTGQLVLRLLLFALSLSPMCFGGEPLEMPPLKDYYEFDLTVNWRMTSAPDDIASTRPQGAHIAHYDVDKQKWFLRNNYQTLSCGLAVEATDVQKMGGFIQMDGMHRRVTAVNGQSPGPPLVVAYGAEVAIRIHNELVTESITLHMHGLHNKWYMDGVANVQQCPIPVRTTYTYRFIADTPGTMWYHGHLGVDRSDGLLGPLIVVKTDESVKTLQIDGSANKMVLPDKQFVMTLQDWSNKYELDGYLNIHEDVMKFGYGMDNFEKCWRSKRTNDGTNIGGSDPVSAIVVNDKGWHNQTDILRRPWALPLERFRVNPGDNALFRIIHGGRSFQMMISIEGHKFQVVAADGPSVEPVETDFVMIYPGERYDILVPAMPNPDRKEYYIIVETVEEFDLAFNPVKHKYAAAVLEYNSFEPNPPMRVPDWEHKTRCDASKQCTVVNCPYAKYPSQANYKCITMGELKSAAPIQDKEVMGTDFKKDFTEYFVNVHMDNFMNGWRFQYPKAPPYFSPEDETRVVTPCLTERCRTVEPIKSKYCNCFHHLNITLGHVVQLNLYNLGGGSVNGFHHPFHLHGYHFYVMKQGFGKHDPTTGFLIAESDDFDCGNDPINPRCNNVSFADPSWLNGRVPGMNTINPPLRDTVVIPAGGYVILRFRADNPGWFFAHCHLVLHHMLGMAFAVRVGERSQMPVPPVGFPSSCGVFDPPRIKPSITGA